MFCFCFLSNEYVLGHSQSRALTKKQKAETFNLGLHVLLSSNSIQKHYSFSENFQEESSVTDIINYAGQVTKFQSHFMDFVRSITTDFHKKNLSADVKKTITDITRKQMLVLC